MKEFVKMLIERLEEWSFETEIVIHGSDGYDDTANRVIICTKNAIEIVNELAEEYNNESVNGDLISRSAVIRELNGIYLDNPYDDKEDILEKAIGIVDHFPAPYQPKGE